MTTRNWILHCSHDLPCELTTARLAERQARIQQTKPANEIPTRLRLIRELTEAEVARLPSVYRQAMVAYEAIVIYQAMVTHAAELGEWHRAVCVPDCPWDGRKLIFPLTT